MGRILTVEQAAEKLQVRPNTVREWLKKGRIPGRKFGRFYRISEDELERMAAGAQPSRPQMTEAERIAHIRALQGKYATPFSAWSKLPQEERERRVRAVMGSLAGGTRTVDDFLKEKHAEVEEEERKWQERHAQQCGPVEGDQVA